MSEATLTNKDYVLARARQRGYSALSLMIIETYWDMILPEEAEVTEDIYIHKEFLFWRVSVHTDRPFVTKIEGTEYRAVSEEAIKTIIDEVTGWR